MKNFFTVCSVYRYSGPGREFCRRGGSRSLHPDRFILCRASDYGVLAIAAVLLGLYAAMRGAKIILALVRGG
jgi:hypothetical protein